MGIADIEAEGMGPDPEDIKKKCKKKK
jgi:hypothetical protein